MSSERAAGALVSGVLTGVVALTSILSGCSATDSPVSSDQSAAPTRAASAPSEPTASSSPSESTASSSPSASAEPEQGTPAPGIDTEEPAKPTADGLQEAVISRGGGDAKAGCVGVADERDVRSGDILGGPFDSALADWGTEQPGLSKDNLRLYWVPLHAKKMPGVTVVAEHKGSGSTVKVSQKSVGEAAEWSFYDTNIKLPKSGSWRLKVSAGQDTGCFDISLGN